MTTLYANPYDTSRRGFYFDDLDEYEAKAETVWGDPDVREHPEHSIDFIDGTSEEVDLWQGSGSPADIEAFFDVVEEPDYVQVTIYAAQELGYASDITDAWERYQSQSGLDMSVRQGTLEDLAAEFVDEGIVDTDYYFDYEKFGRDLAMSGDMTSYLDPDDPDDAEIIDFYESMSNQELGEHVVDEHGGTAHIPNRHFYLDEAKLARDLGMDYAELQFGGTTYTVRGD